MIDLFEHNQIAYESAIAMLLETGKAAIVHPTGPENPLLASNCVKNTSTKRSVGFLRQSISSKHSLKT